MNTSNPTSFRVVTYNVLAQAYVRADRYPGVDPRALAPGPRRALLLRRIAELDADLLCLQEVEADLYEALTALLPGHRGVYEQKHGRPDGAATFIREPRFALEQHTMLHYRACEPDADHLAIVTTVRDTTTEPARELVIANTHLRWQPEHTPVDRHLGVLQIDELLEQLKLVPRTTPRVLAGDLNAISQSPVVARAERAGLALSARSQRPWDTTVINGRRRKIDYLLFDGDLSPSPGALPQLSRDRPMPSLAEPSDHLPLSVDFTWC